MEAKDLEHKIRSAKLSLGDDFGDEQMMEEAIFKAGIKEVVEFITPRLAKISELVADIRSDWTDPRTDCRAIHSIITEIEAKLKDWGIE